MDHATARPGPGRRMLAGVVVTLLAITSLTVNGRHPVETSAALGVAPAAAAATTFDTPGEHAYTVPAGVTRIAITASGGAGGGSLQGGIENRPPVGGPGAIVHSVLTVAPGQVLYAEIGSNAVGGKPGANGGGTAPSGTLCPQLPGAGGGATDLRGKPLTDPGSVASRLLVAAGGGGAGTSGAGISGDGGARGQGGNNPYQANVDSSGALGGIAGVAGKPGSQGQQTGTAGTGGAGGASSVAANGCGGGGGGGYGGGAGGSARAGAAGAGGGSGGGGGGGGGSLDPDGGQLGVAAAPGSTPALTITEAPVTTSTLQVSPILHLAQTDYTNCPSTCQFCDILVHYDDVMHALQCPAYAVQRSPFFDAGWGSQQDWGFHGLKQPAGLASGIGINPADANSPAELGTPFPIADFAHFNVPIRGDSPTSLAIGGHVLVQPPGGAPVDLPFGTHSSGFADAVPLTFLETDNTPPCDPAIQQSATPCDDRSSLQPGPLAPTVVRGVTWHITLLGFDDLHGGYTANLSSEEGRTTERRIFASLTVDTNPTTTALSATTTAVTAHVTPVPSTGGTVSFSTGGTPVAGCQAVPVDTTAGTAACANPGPNPVTAAFSGGVGFAASTSAPASLGDTTAPTTTLTLAPATPSGTNGWYTAAVSVAVAATDAGGGTVAATRCVVDPATPPASYDALPTAACATPLRVSADGQRTVYAASIDSFGNKEKPVATTFRIDKTAPLLAPTVPNPVVLGATAVATPHATDATSGVATSSCAALTTTTAGDHTVRCTATDIAGRTRGVDFHYTVQYRLNLVTPAAGTTYRRGQTVPVQVTLTNANGTLISDAQAKALVTASACQVRFSATGAQTRTSQCMTYSTTTHRFTYNWLVPATGATGPTTLTVTVTYPNTATTTVGARAITIG